MLSEQQVEIQQGDRVLIIADPDSRRGERSMRVPQVNPQEICRKDLPDSVLPLWSQKL